MRLPTPPRSDLASLMTAAGLTDVLADLPKVAAATRRLAAYRAGLESMPDPWPAGVDVEAEARSTIETALNSGKPLPPDAFTAVGRARQNDHARVAVVQFAAGLESALVGELESILRSSVEAICRGLHKCLEDALGEGYQSHEALGGAVAAEDAIEAGLGPQWRALQAARSRYLTTRAAQGLVTRKLEGAELDRIGLLASHFADPLSLWQDLAMWLRLGYAEDGDGNRHDLTPPWPDLNDHGRLFDWLMTRPEARPWVPTPNQRAQAARDIFETVGNLGPHATKRRVGLGDAKRPAPSSYANTVAGLALAAITR